MGCLVCSNPGSKFAVTRTDCYQGHSHPNKHICATMTSEEALKSLRHKKAMEMDCRVEIQLYVALVTSSRGGCLSVTSVWPAFTVSMLICVPFIQLHIILVKFCSLSSFHIILNSGFNFMRPTRNEFKLCVTAEHDLVTPKCQGQRKVILNVVSMKLHMLVVLCAKSGTQSSFGTYLKYTENAL